jgi:hypothetical protein
MCSFHHWPAGKTTHHEMPPPVFLEQATGIDFNPQSRAISA